MSIRYKRVLLKMSGEAFREGENPVDFGRADAAAAHIAMLHDMGVEVGLVLGGGNIWRGRSSGDMDRSRADHMGMLATVINSLAMLDSLEKKGVPAVVFSAIAMNRICSEYTSRDALNALASGKVVIFAGGTGCPFFSTDTAAALRAAEIKADALLCAKSIDAVYTADPHIDPSAKRIPHLSYAETLARDLKAIDQTAVALCREQSIPILFFAMNSEANISAAITGGDVGTLID